MTNFINPFSIQEVENMLDALHDAIDELELNLNTVDDMPEAYEERKNQLDELSKIVYILNHIKNDQNI